MFRSSARIAVFVLAIALVVGFAVSGAFIYDSFIGLDPSAFPLGPAIQDIPDEGAF
jgi:hypothetical protein